MGEVRLTRDARIGRHVAVKRLLEPLSGEATRRRFLREARIQGQLEHPAVVPVYDLDFDEQGQPFFTMKRVRGQTLSRILELSARGDTETRERFGRRRLLAAFTQACHAVHYAHVRGVVHRDLKPSNIMIGDYGEVYVLDWGVARVDKDASDEDERLPVVLDASMGLTRGGDLVGSLGYMAPEQMQGLTVDGRADVFALGVVLYEILTLRPFRKSESFPAMVARVTAGRRSGLETWIRTSHRSSTSCACAPLRRSSRIAARVWASWPRLWSGSWRATAIVRRAEPWPAITCRKRVPWPATRAQIPGGA